jgi:response regulator RpfG family c-di-GMP phosphodiesterase
MRRIRPQATRLLLTGYADKENAIRAINEAGLYYYLEKPWDNEHFKLVVRNGVERAALFNELDARVRALEEAHAELAGFRQKLVKAFL